MSDGDFPKSDFMRCVLTFCLVFLVAACVARAPELPPYAARPQPGSAPSPFPIETLVQHPRFGDADPHDWEGRRPRSYPIHGIDVSRWQGEIDWAKARRAGVSFAFLKATEGGDVVDRTFYENRRAAEKAGVPWGAYHYFYFCRPAAEQARWFIRHVPKGGMLPHVLDMEWNHRSKTCTRRPGKREVRREAKLFLDKLEAHYGRRPILYTTVDFWAETGIGSLGGTEFWLRSVAGHPGKVYPGADWVFWQYTGTGLVRGIEGEVYLNAFRGSAEDWARWIVGGG